MNNLFSKKSNQLAIALSMFLGLTNFSLAKVSEEQASRLGQDLTYVGAEKAGNAQGTIPAYIAPLATDAAKVDANNFYSDPFADESPLFIITGKNFSKYQDNLTPGQIALLKKYPTYTMPVYKTHRTAGFPQYILDDVKYNALNTTAIEDIGLENFKYNFPFPIPQNALEVIFNQNFRYRVERMQQTIIAAIVKQNGNVIINRLNEKAIAVKELKRLNFDVNNKAIAFFDMERTLSPAKQAGNIALIHETSNNATNPRMAWIYNAGQRRVRRTPDFNYGVFFDWSEGLFTVDNRDMYNGLPDRYTWTLNGKKELYIPYNSYRLQSKNLKYADILTPNHLNQTHTRYELHRVWHVTGELKKGERHIYHKRDIYIDEDTWQAAVIDHYDNKGVLWRISEAHAMYYFKTLNPWLTAETIYDLKTDSYLVRGLKNEEEKATDYSSYINPNEFTPAGLRQAGVR